MRAKSSFRHQARGLTLVELLVAMAVGLLLVGAVISVYLGSRQTYKVTESLSRLQENARFAFSFLVRDIRMAGYRGCMGGDVPVVNTLNGNATSFLFNFSDALFGYDSTYNLSLPSASQAKWNDTLAGDITQAAGGVAQPQPLPGRDVLVVRGVYGSSTIVTDHPGAGGPNSDGTPGSADLHVSSNSGLDQGDIVMVADCENAAVFQVTNDPKSVATKDNVVHNTGNVKGVSPGNFTKNLGKSYEGAPLFRIATTTYYIASNPNGNPSLYRRRNSAAAEELVEGVEDLQVVYGVDDDSSGTSDRYLTAKEVTDGNLWEKVISARLTLLMQTTDNSVATEALTVDYGGTSVVAQDRRLRQTFTTTVAIRNRIG